ncbi:hypothetical protein Mapa_016775 [Marchantia paleacea]|nr:hypothetical protein Mapa_016775 [Marchantia paleacea]
MLRDRSRSLFLLSGNEVYAFFALMAETYPLRRHGKYFSLVRHHRCAKDSENVPEIRLEVISHTYKIHPRIRSFT